MIVAVLAILASSACATNPTGAAPTPTRAIAVATPGFGPQAQPAVDAAVRDAATRLNVSASDVRVDQVEARDWPDASLGCPQAGGLYAQVITPGFLIVVAGGGKQLEYHANQRGGAVMCAER
jgi:hypothetical protein